MKLPVYILAGGRSSRFGGDKARYPWRGRPLILQVAQSLAQFASKLTIVAERAGKYDDLGLHTIADGKPGQGPLGGIGAALRDARGSDWILCASCDRIGLKASWIEDLFAAAGKEARVVAFRDERWQPLPALYRTSMIIEVDRALKSGRLSPWQTIESVAHVGLPLPNEWDSSLDINEPGLLSGG